MSCGKPHETPCSEVLSEVWLFLDKECDPARRDTLKQHLDECNPCLEEFGIDEHLKVLLASKCGGEQAPETLKQRLRASIRQTVIDHDGVRTTTTTATVEISEEEA